MGLPPDPLLAARGVSKHFGGELALDNVDLELRPGEVHALLGENGAGKSTLIKILAGVVRPDAGEFAVDGQALPQHFTAPDVVEAGLAFVHQDLGLAEHLSVAENIALAVGYAHRGPLISFRETHRRVATILENVGIDLPPQALVGSLSQDQKVMVAVARAFSLTAKAIVLDEVSSSLPAPEVTRLAAALRATRETGIGYVYVTHRLDEVFEFCDRVTVLRDGRNIATAEVAEVDHAQVVRWILGGENAAAPRAPTPGAATGPVRLRVRGLSGAGLTEPLNFDVAEGQIVALCGLVGCGAREVAALIGGAAKPTAGEAELDGQRLPLGSPAKLRREGCTYVPGDRQGAGGVFNLSVRENLFLSRVSQGERPDSIIRWPAGERSASATLAERFEVRPRKEVDLPLGQLSGGNQQKVIAGRALRAKPRLLVVDDPTAGVDVGSRAQLHRLLREAADDGTVVIVASTDFDEVASEADRALVMCNGRVHAHLSGADLTAEHIAEASYGGRTFRPPMEVAP